MFLLYKKDLQKGTASGKIEWHNSVSVAEGGSGACQLLVKIRN